MGIVVLYIRYVVNNYIQIVAKKVTQDASAKGNEALRGCCNQARCVDLAAARAPHDLGHGLVPLESSSMS